MDVEKWILVEFVVRNVFSGGVVMYISIQSVQSSSEFDKLRVGDSRQSGGVKWSLTADCRCAMPTKV